MPANRVLRCSVEVQGVAVGYSSNPVVSPSGESVTYAFQEDLSLGFLGASSPRVLSHFDPLLTAMHWQAANRARFDATFVRGDKIYA